MYTVIYDDEALQNLGKLEKEFLKKFPQRKKILFTILSD
jgi:mRNA-degrading endonuclease RelE of RelBE toxin-antitoxin system